ncbi:MAG: malto-oligosyltrehalose trehalohydrolase, partial [Verrucomicrobia bacterium]|nr:malto-oligosyltrehalose trehalohydrolase [Verrucomicrobiota bacterium]
MWSPDTKTVSVVINRAGDGGTCILPMEKDAEGWFAAHDPTGSSGDRYFFRLDEIRDVPDVASRYQPEGVRGSSQVMDSGTYAWRHPQWRHAPLEDLVIYEMHVGTFTEEGTFRSAMARLDDLCRLGVTAIELMPIGAFPGDRNWGYDVVLPFAPAHCYGTPDDLRRLVDAAHERNLAVILDVVYNHVCGEPNWLESTSKHFFHQETGNDWGKCLNFDGKHCLAVREYFLQNAIYWVEEFHIDGFRLDAIHAIHDSSPVHILQEITQAVHARGGFLIAEDNSNDAKWLRPAAQGGIGLDAAWADDFHHVVKMSVKPEQIAHFKSYQGTATELADTLDHGWLFRGDVFPYWKRPRGTECLDLSPEQFVYCISNHDQAGNRPLGERLHHIASPEAYRAASALLLLSPYTPMLFMGQEWGASSPFTFFTNHGGEFGARVSKGRCQEFKQYDAAWSPEVLAAMPDPEIRDGFTASKLNWAETNDAAHAAVLDLYRECLRLRRTDPVLRKRDRESWHVWAEGEVVWLLFTGPSGDFRLLLIYLKPGPVKELPMPKSVPTQRT